ncbi:MAG: hypothetical protein M3297_06185 [Thermoproteota archaeon]|nr:hypothetical protein [Thermoproteota archaeon]
MLKDGEVEGQSSAIAKERHDIFKVIMTVDGLNPKSGDVITLVTVNGITKSKLFDDSKTYLSSLNIDKSMVIEYISTFPNVTIKVNDEYKACALFVKNSDLICQTGKNSPASRPEIVDISIK